MPFRRPACVLRHCSLRLRDLNRIRSLAADYDDLRSFVDDFALNRPDPASADQGLKLIASTIHSAK